MNPRLSRDFFDEQVSRLEHDANFIAEKAKIDRGLLAFQSRFNKAALQAVTNDDDLVKLMFQTNDYAASQNSLYHKICFDNTLPVPLRGIPPFLAGAAYIDNKGWINSKQTSIQYEASIPIARAIKTFIIETTDIVESDVDTLYTDIEAKLNVLFNAIGCKTKAFFGKVLGCLFPTLFPPFFNPGWQRAILLNEYDGSNCCENFRKMNNLVNETGLDPFTFGKCIWSDGEMSKLAGEDPSLKNFKKRLLEEFGPGDYSLQDIFDSPRFHFGSTRPLENKLIEQSEAFSEVFNYDKNSKVFTIAGGVASQSVEQDEDEETPNDADTSNDYSRNQLYYGIPGCGKSYQVDKYLETELNISKDSDNKIRTTFFLDYSYNDFIGQLMPQTGASGIEYHINPGPFTLALSLAYQNYDSKQPIALIVEEINRGNAPAIFGDIFQLLDRDDNGNSEYDIVNPIISQYLKEKGIANPFGGKIKIPSNLWIFATMNSSDQNVFKLDTAFKRRWDMYRMTNEDTKTAAKSLNNFTVPGTETSWVDFVNNVNDAILKNNLNEDRQLGYWFLMKNSIDNLDEDKQKERFANKVLEYLWNDVLKFHDKFIVFKNSISSFDDLINKYVNTQEMVFADKILNENEGSSDN